MLTHIIDPDGFCTICGQDINALSQNQQAASATTPRTILRFENADHIHSYYTVPTSSLLIQGPIIERLMEIHGYDDDDAVAISYHLHWILIGKGFRKDLRTIREIDPTASLRWL